MAIKLVIVGGVAGGATAAARARRLRYEKQRRALRKWGHPRCAAYPLKRLAQKACRLDKNKTYIPFWVGGQRVYIGHRTLVQNGYQSKIFSGGLITYDGVKEKILKKST